MVYKLEGKELEEYLAVKEPFMEKLAEFIFRGLRDMINRPGAKVPATLDSVATAIDNHLLNDVTPKVLLKIDKALAEDKNLTDKNNAIKAEFDIMTLDEKRAAIEDFYREQDAAVNKIRNGTDDKKSAVDELTDIFGGKIDPETMN